MKIIFTRLHLLRLMSGAFVYQGSGRKQRADSERSLRECRDEACAIQWCLAKSNTNFKRCEPAIAIWQACFDRAKQRDADEAAGNPTAATAAAAAPR